MNGRTILGALCAAFLFAAFNAPANAQTVKSVAGTYTPVKVAAYGDGARGMLVLDGEGYFSLILARATLPKIAAGARNKGTAEENKAVIDGSIAYFGKYTIDDGGKAITFHLEACTFPNWDGTSITRALKVAGDELTYTVTAPSAGGPPIDVVWKRLK